jgi:hypothetical protein
MKIKHQETNLEYLEIWGDEKGKKYKASPKDTPWTKQLEGMVVTKSDFSYDPLYCIIRQNYFKADFTRAILFTFS